MIQPWVWVSDFIVHSGVFKINIDRLVAMLCRVTVNNLVASPVVLASFQTENQNVVKYSNG